MITNDKLLLFKGNSRFKDVELSIIKFQDNPLKEWANALIVLETGLDSDEGQWLLIQTPGDNLFHLEVIGKDNMTFFSLENCQITAKEIANVVVTSPDDMKMLTLTAHCSCLFRVHVNVD